MNQEQILELVDELRGSLAELHLQNSELQRAKGLAEEALSKYSDLFEFAPVAFFSVNEKGNIIEINRSGANLLEVKKHLLLKRPFASFVAAESRPEFDLFLRKLLETGSKQTTELFLLKNREEPIYVHAEGLAGETKKGGGKQCLITVADITRRKREDEEIFRINRDLQAVIREQGAEIDAFSYAVSHELRENTRHIEGFSRAILENYSGCLDRSGRDYFERILRASGRISDLTNALARFSRISAQPVELTRLDLTAMARSIAAELTRQEPERVVDFVIGEGLKAHGDQKLMEIVLRNLLGNSWKFTQQHNRGRIEFGAEALKGKTVFFVKDDGAGFDMAYSNKLFLPFHRIHPRTAFPGLGLGLAAAKRVIERHGGTIWAEGGIEKGAVFYFTLSEPD